MIIGNEHRRYKVIHDFLSLPESVKLGYTHGIVTDSKDQVYLFNMSEHAVVITDSEGRFLSSWGADFAAGAHGMLLNEEDAPYLYLTDVDRGLVVKTTLQGEVELTLGTPALPQYYDEERRYVPTDVAVASNGDIYVADGYGQHRIIHYDAKGNLIHSWGGYGSKDGELACPHGISVVRRNNTEYLYVADRSNHRIQIFTLEGESVRMFTDHMDEPCSFFAADEELYIPDLKSRITILDKYDQLVGHLGEDKTNASKEGWPNLKHGEITPGTFSSPHGVCVDTRGNIYVAEWTQYGRVTKLCPVKSC